jgi:hypothetical protein
MPPALAHGGTVSTRLVISQYQAPVSPKPVESNINITVPTYIASFAVSD